MTFDEWWDSEGILKGDWEARGPAYETAKLGWIAALKDLIEEQDIEPTPTEMVKRLLDKGWYPVEAILTTLGGLEVPYNCFGHADLVGYFTIKEAYHKAFPPKKKVEVEVWAKWKDNTLSDISTMPTGNKNYIKGKMIFWVEEE